MAFLLSSWSSNLKSLPKNYVVAVEKPGMPVQLSKGIPVVDLGEEGQANIIQKIMKAGQEFGLFQVINHGVSEELMTDAVNVGREFFSLPAEEKAKFVDQDAQNGCMEWLEFKEAEEVNDRKCIAETTQPHQNRNWYPPEQGIIRVNNDAAIALQMNKTGRGIVARDSKGELVKACALQERKRGEPLIEEALAIREALLIGQEAGWRRIEVQSDSKGLIEKHQDIYGLQVFKDGHWLGVELLPNGFVINICFFSRDGTIVKLISENYRYDLDHHCRTSLANSVNFASHGIIEPAKSLVSPSNPPLFSGFHCKEYFEVLLSNNSDTEATAEYFTIRSQTIK
ncbi:hyoscyamine 6-dioxygenase-like [Coffea eugenioides]|uniref:hyoscyamine 6-dioxygenase-like n=1 Tax=Coffea eugenioides TaxID=49369 RepID=UPI000F60E83D|nr:hyoscyamine 6-dioxygenase-like [Coffea eugenioides]